MDTGRDWPVIVDALRTVVGASNVRLDEVDRAAYAIDAYWAPRFAVDRDRPLALPDAVVSVGSAEELVEVVRIANRHRVPVVPFGGGSNSQGAVLPVHGGLTVDLKRLDRLLEVDTRSGTFTAEAGINGAVLEAELARHGWTFPHYPASAHAATLGGYLACRGSGTVSTKYGKAEDLVLWVDVVLPDGDRMRTLPVPNHAAGPGILQCFVGAEGTFGVIVAARMRMVPIPEVRRFRSYLFPDVHSGLEAGRRIMIDRLEPCVIRLYDEASTVRTVRHVLGTEVARGAYCVLGFDGFEDLVDVQARRAHAICTALGATDLGEDAGRHWWDHRYHFYFPPKAPDLPWMFGTLDTVTTFDRIEALVDAKRQRLQTEFARWSLVYYAHFSHWFPWGAMVYDRFVIESPPVDPAEALALHDRVWDVATEINLAHGGVINEHHGVGLKLARHVRRQFGSGFRLVDAIKREIDPHGLLNPGKMGFGPPR